MENASKALIMAGGVMLVILIIALVIFAWSRFSQFYSSQDELRYIEDAAKFNEQFAEYDRLGVSGYELVSLANRVADYNFRFSNASDAKNDINGSPIHLTIKFGKDKSTGDANRLKLTYDEDIAKKYRLFISNEITSTADGYNQNSKNLIGNILKEVANIEALYGSPEETAKVAKSIGTIELKKAAQYYYSKNYSEIQSTSEGKALRDVCTKNFRIATGKSATEIKNYNDVDKYIGINGEKIYRYYEYYQFKRGVFDCTDFKYDSQGRVTSLTFLFTGKIK